MLYRNQALVASFIVGGLLASNAPAMAAANCTYCSTSGSVGTAAAAAALGLSGTISNALGSRAGLSRELSQTGFASGNTGLSGGEPGKGWAVWVQPIGEVGDVNSSVTGIAGTKADISTVGVLTGVEAQINNTVVGISYGFAENSINLKGAFSGNTTVDNHILSLYGEQTLGRLFVDGNIGYTFKDLEIKTPGSSNTTGGDFGLATTVGYTFTPAGFIVEPSLGLRYDNATIDSFTAADAAHSLVSNINIDSLKSVLGVRLAKPIALSSGTTLVPELRAGWEHELLSNNSNYTVGAAGQTVRWDQDAGVIGVGLKAQMNPKLNLFIDYTGRFSSNETDHGFSAGVKFKF